MLPTSLIRKVLALVMSFCVRHTPYRAVADLRFGGPDALAAVGAPQSLTVGHSRLVAESLNGKGLSASYQGIYISLKHG